jgi:hypothetical protein
MIPSNYVAAAVFALVAALAILGGFQIALAAGAPLGRFAWGGQHPILPPTQRAGSLASVAVYCLIAVVALDRAGQIDLVPDLVSRIGMWIVFGYLALSIVPNSLSRSRPERSVMAPVSALLAGLSLAVALA